MAPTKKIAVITQIAKFLHLFLYHMCKANQLPQSMEKSELGACAHREWFTLRTGAHIPRMRTL